MIQVVFVCLGNICRSPLAEGILNSFLEKEGLSHQVTCDSAGTGNYHVGETAHPMSRRVAHENGIELTSRSRQFESSDFNTFDYIIVMDASNKRNLRAFDGYDQAAQKVFLMREFDHALSGKDVEDTYYGGYNGFEVCYKILNECCGNVIHYLKKQHPQLG